MMTNLIKRVGCLFGEHRWKQSWFVALCDTGSRSRCEKCGKWRDDP